MKSSSISFHPGKPSYWSLAAYTFLGQSRAREQACKQVEILLLSEGTRDVCNLEEKKNVRDVKIVVLKCLKAFRGRRIFFSVGLGEWKEK